MAPVVHGLEREYEGNLDFVYLNVAEERNAEAMRIYGFRATPHFFFLRADGSAAQDIQGVVAADSIRAALDALLAPPR
jgi:thioredoxin-like negative regulator of GroEL